MPSQGAAVGAGVGAAVGAEVGAGVTQLSSGKQPKFEENLVERLLPRTTSVVGQLEALLL